MLSIEVILETLIEASHYCDNGVADEVMEFFCAAIEDREGNGVAFRYEYYQRKGGSDDNRLA